MPEFDHMQSEKSPKWGASAKRYTHLGRDINVYTSDKRFDTDSFNRRKLF